MSLAAAGTLACELNLPICYLDGAWDPHSGAAGLKKASVVTLMSNPSRRRGYEIRRMALAAYERNDFNTAAEGFQQSCKLLDDSFFDQLGVGELVYNSMGTRVSTSSFPTFVVPDETSPPEARRVLPPDRFKELEGLGKRCNRLDELAASS
jgi:hypothetical protein